MQMKLNANPAEKDVDVIRNNLREYNGGFLETKTQSNYMLTMQDEKIIGGIVFRIFGLWLEIDYFWIDGTYRGKGFGKILLDEAERIGKVKGCEKCSLNTFAFQARPFYEKNGYEVVYEQRDYPISGTRFYMEKDL